MLCISVQIARQRQSTFCTSEGAIPLYISYHRLHIIDGVIKQKIELISSHEAISFYTALRKYHFSR